MTVRTFFPIPARCVLAAALTLATSLGVAIPAAAQNSVTQWAVRAQAQDLATGETDTIAPRSGLGTENFVQSTIAGDFSFIARPEVVPNSPSLKSGVGMTIGTVNAGNAMQAIGEAKAVFSDTLTVVAAPGFNGGALRFLWGLGGTFSANLSGAEPYLNSVGWDFYQAAELFVTGTGIPRTEIARQTFQFIPGAVPPAADIFVEYLELPGSNIAQDENRIDVEQVVGAAGGHAFDIAVAPGAGVQLDFHLYTGSSFALSNIDYGGLFAGHLADFSNTATLHGVQLLDASGNPYGGAWSLASANGIAYTLLPVPEPGTWALWLTGLIGLGAVARRRRRCAH